MELNSITFLLFLLILAFSFWVIIFFHELGHAIAILLMTKGKVEFYIGSFGDPGKSIRISLGRLVISSKYNPILWVKGCCRPPNEEISVYKKILFTACGPLVSVLITLITWYLLATYHFNVGLKLLVEGFFCLSFGVSFACLIPTGKLRFNHLGRPLHNDAKQILNLYKSRKYFQNYWKIVEHVRNKSYSSAVALTEQIIRKGENGLHVYRIGVVAYCYTGEYEKTMEINDSIKTKYRFNADDYTNSGLLYIMTNQFDNAVKSLEQALIFRPNHIYAMNNLGYVLCLQEKYDESLIQLDKTILSSPSFSPPYSNRGLTKIQMGDIEGGCLTSKNPCL